MSGVPSSSFEGPRFSTKAESRWFTQAGWEVIGMTQYPEAYLALEQDIAVVNIALITDYDAGLVGRRCRAGDPGRSVRASFRRTPRASRAWCWN